MAWPFDPLLDALSAIAEGFLGLLKDALAGLTETFSGALGVEKPSRQSSDGGGGEALTPQSFGGGGQVGTLDTPPTVTFGNDVFEAWSQKLSAANQWLDSRRVDEDLGMPGYVLAELDKLLEKAGLLKPVAMAIFSLLWTGAGMLTSMRKMQDIREQALNRQFKMGLPDIGTLIHVAFRHPEAQTQMKQLAEYLGYEGPMYELFEESLRRALNPEEIRALYLRGEFGDIVEDKEAAAERDKRLRALGLSDEDIAWIVKLYEWIPPVQDLIRFSVREVYDPEFHAENRLIDPAPLEFIRELKRTGGTQLRAEQYWDAHWELPSVQQGFQMLHRKVIDEAELARLLRARDVMPAWRDKLQAISYRPITRVDLRRMHKIGLIDEARLQQGYEDIGFAPENAALMAQFTIDFNLGRERDLSRSQLEKFFIEGTIDENQLAEGLTRLRYTATDIDLLISKAQLDRIERLKDLEVERIRDEYAVNVHSDAAAIIALVNAGVEELEATRRVAAWKRDKRALEKRLSIDDLKAAYEHQVIDQGELRAELRELGYVDRHIDIFVQTIGAGA